LLWSVSDKVRLIKT